MAGYTAAAAGNTALINASGYGSFILGHVRALTADTSILTTARGAGAFGYGLNGQDILASAINAFQFGPGTNAIERSLQIGSKTRLRGIENRVESSFGVFVDGDQAVDITFPGTTLPAGFATGYQYGPGISRFVFSGAVQGGMISGVTKAGAGATAEIVSENGGFFAGGYAGASGSGGLARIEAAGVGNFAHGIVSVSGGYGRIRAAANGSHAHGRIAITSGDGQIDAAGIGSHAHGMISGGANTALIQATGSGSHASGYIYGANNIRASGYAAFAHGYSNTGEVLALATNSVQWGPGSNSQTVSLQVGTTMRLKGTVGAPTSNLHDGDIWVDGGNVVIRSGGVSVIIA